MTHEKKATYLTIVKGLKESKAELESIEIGDLGFKSIGPVARTQGKIDWMLKQIEQLKPE